MITFDQNNKTNSTSYSYLFNYLSNITKIDNIKIMGYHLKMIRIKDML